MITDKIIIIIIIIIINNPLLLGNTKAKLDSKTNKL